MKQKKKNFRNEKNSFGYVWKFRTHLQNGARYSSIKGITWYCCCLFYFPYWSEKFIILSIARRNICVENKIDVFFKCKTCKSGIFMLKRHLISLKNTNVASSFLFNIALVHMIIYTQHVLLSMTQPTGRSPLKRKTTHSCLRRHLNSSFTELTIW